MERGLALLPAVCLLISALALQAQARFLPETYDCGPLQKHRYRCDPPLTQNNHANSGQLTSTDMRYDTSSSIQVEDQFHQAPTEINSSSIDSLKLEGFTDSSISGAAHEHVGDGVEVTATPPPSLIPTAEGLNSVDPKCGPLEKHRYRCNSPLIQTRDP